MQKVLILKRTAFGDIIHTLPVVSALRKHLDDPHITWISASVYAPFLERVSGIDEVVDISFRKMFLSGQLATYRQNLRRVTSADYDVLIDFQGTMKSWNILLKSKAETKLGFNRADAREPFTTRFYTRQVPPMPYGMHIIRQYLRLLQPLGIDEKEIVYPEFKVTEADNSLINTWRRKLGHKKLVAVNPFTNWMTKCWPEENAAEFCRLLCEATDFQPVILWGPKEKMAAERIVSCSSGSALLAPPTNLIQLAAFLKQCSAYVGGDTGPSHLSAAFSVPVVYLFGPTDPGRNGPFRKADLVLHIKPECKRTCRRNECKMNEKVAECMRLISPREALDALLQRLDQKGDE